MVTEVFSPTAVLDPDRALDAARPRVEAYCRRRLRNEHDAADAVQETFFKAWRKQDTWKGAGSIEAWVMAIARNVCTDIERQRSRVSPMADVDVEVSVEEDEETIDLTHVASAIGRLNDRHRTIIELREIEGLSYDEIASRERLHLDAVKSVLFRARQALRREYAVVLAAATEAWIGFVLRIPRSWRRLRLDGGSGPAASPASTAAVETVAATVAPTVAVVAVAAVSGWVAPVPPPVVEPVVTAVVAEAVVAEEAPAVVPVDAPVEVVTTTVAPSTEAPASSVAKAGPAGPVERRTPAAVVPVSPSEEEPAAVAPTATEETVLVAPVEEVPVADATDAAEVVDEAPAPAAPPGRERAEAVQGNRDVRPGNASDVPPGLADDRPGNAPDEPPGRSDEPRGNAPDEPPGQSKPSNGNGNGGGNAKG